MAKPLNAGRAASNGLLAALLAHRGFTAPKDVFEGRRGFLSLFGGNHWPDRITEGCEGQWAVEKIVFKQFPSCYSTHAPMIAALSLRNKCTLVRIRSIHLWVAPMDLGAASIGFPENASEARFSLSYCTAVALVMGRGSLSEFSPTALNDTQVRHIASLMKIDSRPSLREFEAIMELELEDGDRLEAKTHAGEISPTNGWAPVVERKFLEGVMPMVGSRRAQEIAEKLYNLDSAADLGEFIQLLALHVTIK